MGIFPGHPLHSREEAAGRVATLLPGCLFDSRCGLLKAQRPGASLPRMNLLPRHSVRVSQPLSLVAVLLSSFVLVNAFVVGCGGGGGGTESGSAESGGPSESGGESTPAVDGAGGGDGLVAQGQTLYAEKCALCHGATGVGDGPGAAALDPKPRNHTDGSYMNAQSNESLVAVIKDGKGQMPAWGATMSDDEVRAVLAYVRTLAEPAYSGPMP